MPSLLYFSENNLLNAPNVNLLPTFAMFNEPHVWNVVSGTATITYDTTDPIEGVSSLKIRPTTPALVNAGGSQMSFEIQQDGRHIFAIRHKGNCATLNTQEVRVKVYVNSTPTDYTFFADTAYNDEYRTYAQIIDNLFAGDVVDFAFEFLAPAYGGVFKHSFDAFKFEFDSYGLGIPTVFSEPISPRLSLTQTIDIPSIGSNDFYIGTVTLTGAQIGDNVLMTYPSELITLGLVVGVPLVTDVDTIKFVVHNHGGGSVNPASGSFTFKINK